MKGRVYGSLSFDGKERRWCVTCDPHVSARLKRVFAGLSTGSMGEHRLSDTADIARDLEWFVSRYPLTLVGDAAKRLRGRADEHRKRQQTIENIAAGHIPPIAVELAIPLREYQQQAVAIARQLKSLILADDLGLGKQMPVDTGVLTPSGYRRIGDLRIGDRVISSNGQATTVTGTYPQGVRPNYRMHLSDGASVESGDEHLWTVAYYIGGRRLHEITVTTEQLRTGATIETKWPNGVTGRLSLAKTKVYLPLLAAPVEFQEGPPLPLSPYLLGLLIANGSLAGNGTHVTCNTKDWAEIVGRLEGDGVNVGAVHVYGGATRAGINGVHPRLVSLGLNVLSAEKRIPPSYLLARPHERIALLHGLMDGDGSCSATGNRATYHSTARPLSEDVRLLVEQLGGTGHIHEYERSDEGKPTEYPVSVRLPPSITPFTVSRKQSRYRPKRRVNPTREVRRFEYSRDVESVCISVDADDQLFVTEHAILTHNTAVGVGLFADPSALPALVVTMTHLPTQWQNEIARFAPKLRTHILRKGTPYPLDLADTGGKGRQLGLPGAMPDVIITSYSKIAGWAETLAGRMKTLVLDEGQELRHSDSQRYGGAEHIARGAEYVLMTTATPIYNQGGEFHSVANIVRPDALGTREEFIREWCNQSYRAGSETIRDPKAFGEHVREIGLMVRRTRADVGRELKPLTRVMHHVEADLDALDKVSDACRELALFIVGRGASPLKLEGEARKGEAMLASEELSNKLRQATGIAKAPYVAEFVRMLAESETKIVLYGWHREVYRIWLEKLADLQPVMYTGSETAKEKDAAKDAFINGDARILIMSLRAGAGLDGLQKVCRTLVFGELDWAYGVHEQDEGRLDRDGQTEPVFAYYPTTDTGSDPIVLDVLGIKRNQLEGLRDPKMATIERLQLDPDRIKKLAAAYLDQRTKGQAA